MGEPSRAEPSRDFHWRKRIQNKASKLDYQEEERIQTKANKWELCKGRLINMEFIGGDLMNNIEIYG
jgi:hypothetical protein